MASLTASEATKSLKTEVKTDFILEISDLNYLD